MKQHLSILPLAFLAFFMAPSAGFAAGQKFECPQQLGQTLRLNTNQLSALLPVSDPLSEPDKINAAVDVLRARNLPPALIIDGLIGSYCPVVAGNNSLSDAQKAARVQQFAMRITRLVYGIEGADAIILDVTFDPLVVDAINSRARAAGLTPEVWIAQTVDKALLAPR